LYWWVKKKQNAFAHNSRNFFVGEGDDDLLWQLGGSGKELIGYSKCSE